MIYPNNDQTRLRITAELIFLSDSVTNLNENNFYDAISDLCGILQDFQHNNHGHNYANITAAQATSYNFCRNLLNNQHNNNIVQQHSNYGLPN